MPSIRSWLPLSLLLLGSATVLGLIIEYTTWLTETDERIAAGLNGLDRPWSHPIHPDFWYRLSELLAAVFSSTGGMIILALAVAVLLWGSGAAVMISGLAPVFAAAVVPRLPRRFVGPRDVPLAPAAAGRGGDARAAGTDQKDR